MDTHKSLDLNDTLEFILYGGSDSEDIANSNSDFEPNDSTTENLAAVRKLGALGKNQDTPQQQEFKESDKDDITLSNRVNSNANTVEKRTKNVPAWRKIREGEHLKLKINTILRLSHFLCLLKLSLFSTRAFSKILVNLIY